MSLTNSLYLAIWNNEYMRKVDDSYDLTNYSCANCCNRTSYLITYKYHILNPIHTGWFTICKTCMNKSKTSINESKKLFYFLKLSKLDGDSYLNILCDDVLNIIQENIYDNFKLKS